MMETDNDFAKIVIPRIKMIWVRKRRKMKINRIFDKEVFGDYLSYWKL